jgi:hypothetical protein
MIVRVGKNLCVLLVRTHRLKGVVRTIRDIGSL